MRFLALLPGLLPLIQDPPPLRLERLDPVHVEDLSSTGRLFAEWSVQDNAVYVGERVDVELLIGIAEPFLQDELMPLLQAPLDIPVQVSGALVLEQPGERSGERDGLRIQRREAPANSSASLVIGETLVRVEQTTTQEREGRRYRCLILRWQVRATRAGSFAWPGPALRMARATQFREDLLQGRVALDRRDALWRGAPYTLEVLDLPSSGRSAEFSGAVGSFSLSARVTPSELAVGDSLQVVVQIDGDPDLDHACLPTLQRWPGLEWRGRSTSVLDNGIAAQEEFVLRDPGLREIAPIRWLYFDPGRNPGYRELVSAALPLRVKASTTPVAPAPLPPAEPSNHNQLWIFGSIVLSVSLLGWILFRRRVVIDVELQRSRVALAAVRDQLKLNNAPPRRAYELFLALRVGQALGSLATSHVAETLKQHGVEAALAQAAQTWLEQLEAADFGGRELPNASERTRSLCEQLAQAEEERAARSGAKA